MAFVRPALESLRDVVGKVRKQTKRPRVVTFSCQDVIASRETLAEIFGEDLVSRLRWRPDASDIVRWHKSEHVSVEVADWSSLLSELGCSSTVCDLQEFRGGEVRLDLNLSPPAWLRQAFDVAIDNVATHCANASQALLSIADAVVSGGYVVHVTPLLMVNHGYWLLSPCLLREFYEHNGFEVRRHTAYVHDRKGEYQELPLDVSRRMRGIPDDAMQIFVARRKTLQPLSWPLQKKFVQHPDSKIRKGSVDASS
jgi:hypothetical protein